MTVLRRIISAVLTFVLLAGMVPPMSVSTGEPESTQPSAAEEVTVVTGETEAPAETRTAETEPTAEPVTEPAEETVPVEVTVLETEPAVTDSPETDNSGTTGICGEELIWSFEEAAGTLTISGEGAMYDYLYGEAPWYSRYREAIMSVVIADGVTTIGDGAFFDCCSLNSILIPNGITSIGDYALSACHSLTAVEIPPSVTQIGQHGLSNCLSLESLTIPVSVTSIADSAFVVCNALRAINVDENNPSYCSADGILYSKDRTELIRCPGGYEGMVTVLDGAVNVKPDAFWGCNNVTDVILPESVRNIGKSAFSNCQGLKTVTVYGDGVCFGDTVFWTCQNMESITFTGTAPSFGTDCFLNDVTTIYYPGNDASWGSLVGSDLGGTITWAATAVKSGACGDDLTWTFDDSTGTLTISGTGRMDDFFDANAAEEVYTPWRQLQQEILHVVMEEGVANIGEYTFSRYPNLQSVSIPESVTDIGMAAFGWNPALAEITIPGGVSEILDFTFVSCTGLKTVTFTGDAPAIADQAFTDTTTTACYPADNATWTADKRQNYGGSITWVPSGTAVMTQDQLEEAIAAGEISIRVDSGITLKKDLAIPEGVIVTVTESASLTVAAKKTLHIDGTLCVAGALTVKGRLTGNKVIAEQGGTISAPEGSYITRGRLVTSVQIGSDLTMGAIGRPVQMTAKVLPADAWEPKLRWRIVEGGEAAEIDSDTGILTASAARTVKVRAEATDGSGVYGEASISFTQYSIALSTDSLELTAGESAAISAQFLPGNLTDTGIVWSLAEGDEQYASLKAKGNSVTVAAKDVTEQHEVTVTAAGKDGVARQASVKVTISPKVQMVVLRDGNGADLTGQKIQVDLNRESTLQLFAAVLPADAEQNIVWKSSDTKIAALDETGLVTFRDAGTVKITAAAQDGSKLSASVTIQTVRLLQKAEMAHGSVTELIAGKSASFKAVDPQTGKTLKSSRIQWELAREDAPFAKVTPAGKLTAYKIASLAEVTLVGRIVGNEEYGVVEHTVRIYPTVTQAEIFRGTEMVNGQTLRVDIGGAPVLPELSAKLYPADAKQGVIWKSSKTKIADVDPDTGKITWKGIPGTVTITATARDGSKKSASVKLQFGAFAKEMKITAPDFMRSGDKAVTLTATITSPAAPTTKGVVWSLVNSDDSAYVKLSASGKLTPRMVNDVHVVPIRVTSKDGALSRELAVTIKPKADGILILRDSSGTNVTQTTQNLDVNSSPSITLSAHTLGQDDMVDAQWQCSKSAVLVRNEDGSVTVSLPKGGSAAVTATADGRKATVTVKGVKLTNRITITEKTGATTLASGKSLALKAALEDRNGSTPTTKGVIWSLEKGAEAYASVDSKGKLTAHANYTGAPVEVVVLAGSKDGGAVGRYPVTIHPLAQGMRIHLAEDEATNITYVHDMEEDDSFKLAADVYPMGKADQNVIWQSSNKKIAKIDEKTGEVTCIKPGTVTITATARDGSRQKAAFRLTVVRKTRQILLEDAVITAGKTLKLKAVLLANVENGILATNQNVTWSMTGDIAYAAVSNKGVLKTRKVTEKKTVFITATAQDDPDVSFTCRVDICPAANASKSGKIVK